MNASTANAELLSAMSEYAFGLRQGTVSLQSASDTPLNPLADPAAALRAARAPPALRFCLLEDIWCTVKLQANGFQLASADADADVDAAGTKAAMAAIQPHVQTTFESMDALLNTISPLYRDRFQSRLADRLASLAAARDADSDDNT
ncbi:hypothetical protein BC831DRAFT_433938 [Entophlyctis helioformis]|nr:hypothetical protein BC831DRAFT_433938 [Entophlyctis helioformis]